MAQSAKQYLVDGVDEILLHVVFFIRALYESLDVLAHAPQCLLGEDFFLRAFRHALQSLTRFTRSKLLVAWEQCIAPIRHSPVSC